MKAKLLGCVVAFAVAVSLATAQQSANLLPPVVQKIEVQPDKDKKQKDKDKKDDKKLTDPPATDFFTRTSEGPIRDALGYNPHMMGDLHGKFANVSATVFATQTITVTTTVATPVLITTTTTTTAAIPAQRTFLVPVPNYGAFKVAENASPLPIDRVFFTYNYWNSVRYGPSQLGGFLQTQTTQQQLRGTLIRTNIVTFLPSTPIPYVDLHREVFGFEKTFLDGRASVEFRLPVYQQLNGGDDFRAAHLGDITIIGKYALFLDRDTGDVFSAGLAVTAPTSPGINTVDGRVHDTLLQPWFGYVKNWDRLYVQGFHSCVLPTDSRDVSVFFNDVGVGYWLRRDDEAAIRFIVPTIEAHVTTPLSNRDISSPIYMPDQVALTAGVHLGVGRRSILSIGVVTPVTGPRTYSMEGFAQFNVRF